LYGTDGFHLDLLKDGKLKSVTAMEYCCWRLMQCEGLNVVQQHGGRLFQQ